MLLNSAHLAAEIFSRVSSGEEEEEEEDEEKEEEEDEEEEEEEDEEEEKEDGCTKGMITMLMELMVENREYISKKREIPWNT